MTRTLFLFFIFLFLNSCIGFKPFGLRKVQFSTTRSYYQKNKPKDIVHTRRLYIKNCPGCKEIIRTKKKQYLSDGRVIYREKVKRRMYKAKLLKMKSASFYDNGKLKEKRKLIRGTGYIKRFSSDGTLQNTDRFKKGKPVGKTSGADTTLFLK